MEKNVDDGGGDWCATTLKSNCFLQQPRLSAIDFQFPENVPAKDLEKHLVSRRIIKKGDGEVMDKESLVVT